MRSDTQLDYAVFQLTPNLERCELHVVSQGSTYKLASGLLKPFLVHLVTAEQQITSGGQSIRLEPPDPTSATWFTKGTMERFVRFVSTPEVLEMVSSIEMELCEVEEAIRVQSSDASVNQTPEDQLSTANGGKSESAYEQAYDGGKSGLDRSTKQWLLRALDARWMVLQKEQSILFTRATAAGFNVKNVNDLVIFAETFEAPRLRDACIKFIAVCQKKKETGLWPDNIESGVTQIQSVPKVASAEDIALYPRAKEYPDAWPNVQGREMKPNEFRRASLPADGNLPTGGTPQIIRQGSIEKHTSEILQMAGRGVPPHLMPGGDPMHQQMTWSPSGIQPLLYGMHQFPSQEIQSTAYADVNSEYLAPGRGIGLGLPVGQSNVVTWEGTPQDQYPQNIPPYMPPVYNLPGPYRHPSDDLEAWQMLNAGAPPTLPAHQGQNDMGATMNNKVNGALPASQHQEADVAAPTNEKVPVVDSAPIINQEALTAKGPEETADIENVKLNSGTPALEKVSFSECPESAVEPPHEPNTTSVEDQTSLIEPKDSAVDVQKSSLEYHELALNSDETAINADELMLDSKKTMVDLQNSASSSENDVNDEGGESNKEMDKDSTAEPSRRLPRRGASPGRRSASPMRRVQIGRSGLRRPGVAAKRSISYNTRDQNSISDESVETGSENEKETIDRTETRQAEIEQVRVRVQDVIGLFESKKEDNIKAKKPISQKESRRLTSKNSVLSRWADPQASQHNVGGGQTLHVTAEQDNTKEAAPSKEQMESTLNGNSLDNINVDDHAEQGNLNIKSSPADDSFIDLSRRSLSPGDNIKGGHANSYLEQSPSDDSYIIFEPRVPEGGLKSSEMHSQDDSRGGSKPAQDLESEEEIPGTKDDDQKVQNVNLQTGNGIHDVVDGESGENAGETSAKKKSGKEAKAKAMQDMLEKRKASAGNRSSKPNPLAEAQSRAEKLRAYKASLQQSKKEKEEEERKRIEDLKTQRRERIASRNQSLTGTPLSESSVTKKSPRTPPVNASRSSPVPPPHTSNSSPRSSLKATVSLSPNVSKSKGSSGNKPPRTPSGSSKKNENPLSLSVPSLNELRELSKESPKPTSAVRSSTGSQRFNQLKKTPTKDADSVPVSKSVSHSDEKKRPSLMANGRKGIPPAKDAKGETSPSVKNSKTPTSVSKQQRRNSSGLKPSTKKESAENGNNVETVATPEVTCPTSEAEEKENNEAAVELNNEVGVQQANASAEDVLPLEKDSDVISKETDPVCELDETVQEPTVLDETQKIPEETNEPKDDSVDVESDNVGSDGEQLVLESISKTREDFDAQATSDSPKNDTVVGNSESAALPVMPDDEEHDAATTEPDPAPVDQKNPSDAYVNDFLLNPSKNLPRLHEAIQQAHSPDLRPGATKSRKTGSQKGSKDRFKRLLLLGRKSNRTSVTELDDGHEVKDRTSGNNARSGGNGGADGLSNQVSTTQSNNNRVAADMSVGTSSSKGSRSFFSLSALRGKSEGKAV